jgi:hypothetical protein
MITWKDIKTEKIPSKINVDVLVVGGGPAGIAAALSAARLGASVMIVEQFNCLGGVATSGGHNHFSQFNAWGDTRKQVVGGIADELRRGLLKRGVATYDGSCLDFDLEGMKLILDELVSEAGIAVLFYSFYCDTLMDGDTVIGGLIQNKTGRQVIVSKRIIDCTGDGDAAFHSGAAFEQGRPHDGRCQPTTLMFTIAGVDWSKVEAWRTSYQMAEAWEKAQQDGVMESFQSAIMGFWHTDILPDQVGVNMTHIVNVDSTKTEDLTWATIEGRRQAHHLITVFRQVVPGMERCYLISTAPSLGLRESRRIKGVVCITAEHLMYQRQWEDSIGYGSFYIDIHNPTGPGMGEQTWHPPRGFHYQIPYRALVPEKVDNLLVAGRCISADHVALGSLRIMATCMVTGEAAGSAAILSIHDEVSPRQVDPQRLRNQLRKQNVIISEDDILNVETLIKDNAILRQQASQ